MPASWGLEGGAGTGKGARQCSSMFLSGYVLKPYADSLIIKKEDMVKSCFLFWSHVVI